MKAGNRIKFEVLVISSAFITALFFGCNSSMEPGYDKNSNEINQLDNAKEEGNVTGKNNDIAVESPPFSEGIYPCNDCHKDLKPNPLRRALVDMHDSISSIFDHDSENRWCLDCHDMNDRNYLRLANGKLLDFSESYKLCGQCHGDKLRDWKVGVHGKRTGEWNGKKQYLLCVHCHNPHSPRFKALTPLPPPVRQEDIQK
jgi:hypothetical protein